MNIFNELIEPQEINFDLEHLRKQVIAVTQLNYQRHFRELILEWYQDTLKYPELMILNDRNFFKELWLINQIPYLTYSPKDSIRYESKGKVQYRLVFCSIDRSNMNSYKDLEKITVNVNGKNIDIYKPFLMVSANISNNVLNSISIFTVLHIDNILQSGNTFKEEFSTRIEDMKFKLKMNDGSVVMEVFQKYINKKVDIDYDIETVKNIVRNRINEFIKEMIIDFDKSVEGNRLLFMKGFPIADYINIDKIINSLVYDHEESSINKFVFTNYIGMKTAAPIFRFNNRTLMQSPLFRVDIRKDKDNTADTIILNISINFINIPMDEEYYIKNGTDKYVYTFSKSIDID